MRRDLRATDCRLALQLWTQAIHSEATKTRRAELGGSEAGELMATSASVGPSLPGVMKDLCHWRSGAERNGQGEWRDHIPSCAALSLNVQCPILSYRMAGPIRPHDWLIPDALCAPNGNPAICVIPALLMLNCGLGKQCGAVAERRFRASKLPARFPGY